MKTPNIYERKCKKLTDYLTASPYTPHTSRTALAIYSGRYDATCIAGTLATWEEALETDVLEGFSITHDAHRGRGASLGGYQDSLIGEKTVGILAEGLEAFLQTLAHEIGIQKWSGLLIKPGA